MAVYLWDNGGFKPLVVDGKIATHEDCCCSPDIECGYCQPGTTPFQLQLSVSGNCYPGTYILNWNHDEPHCHWMYSHEGSIWFARLHVFEGELEWYAAIRRHDEDICGWHCTLDENPTDCQISRTLIHVLGDCDGAGCPGSITLTPL